MNHFVKMFQITDHHHYLPFTGAPVASTMNLDFKSVLFCQRATERKKYLLYLRFFGLGVFPQRQTKLLPETSMYQTSIIFIIKENFIESEFFACNSKNVR